jgi:hypothetical protein
MRVRIDMRKTAIAAVTIVAMVAFLVPPLCQVSSCGMSSDMMHGMYGSSSSAGCGLGDGYSAAAAGVVPTGFDFSSLLAAMLVGFAIAFAAPTTVRRTALARARSGAPPPDPLGVRLLV